MHIGCLNTFSGRATHNDCCSKTFCRTFADACAAVTAGVRATSGGNHAVHGSCVVDIILHIFL